jgi:hypothetical protein
MRNPLAATGYDPHLAFDDHVAGDGPDGVGHVGMFGQYGPGTDHGGGPGKEKGDGCADADDRPFEIDVHMIVAVAAGKDVVDQGLADRAAVQGFGFTSSSSWRFNISRARLRDTVSSRWLRSVVSSIFAHRSDHPEKLSGRRRVPALKFTGDMQQVRRGQPAALNNKVFFQTFQGKVTIGEDAGDAGQLIDGTRSFLEQGQDLFFHWCALEVPHCSGDGKYLHIAGRRLETAQAGIEIIDGRIAPLKLDPSQAMGATRRGPMEKMPFSRLIRLSPPRPAVRMSRARTWVRRPATVDPVLQMRTLPCSTAAVSVVVPPTSTTRALFKTGEMPGAGHTGRRPEKMVSTGRFLAISARIRVPSPLTTTMGARICHFIQRVF